MNYTVDEAFQYIEENDVKFIRLAFCDIFGNLKNISIQPRELSRAFEKGIPFNASALKGFMKVAKTDLLLFPDSKTLTILPWRPTHGRVIRFLCNICYPDGTPFEGDGRRFLLNAVKEARKINYNCHIGTESEFYLFKLDDNGNETNEIFDKAGYLDVAPLDKGENVRREICLTLDQMGIIPEQSYHEHGPGQNEIDFMSSGALKAADDFITFRFVVSTIAAQYGLYASFDPKPVEDNMGNSFHINMSLIRENENVFKVCENEDKPSESESFSAGVLRRIKEISLFLNPTERSYMRLGKMDAPKVVSWSRQNKSQLVRISPALSGERLEVRSPDTKCNPYFAFGLMIYAGIEGINEGLRLPSPIDINFEEDKEASEKLEKLPTSLSEAYELATNSVFVKKYISDEILDVLR